MANEQTWAAQFASARQQAATSKKKEGQKTGTLGMIEEKAEELIQEPSKKALKACWLNCIETYGLTLIYVIFHFIMKYLGGPFSRFFCKMGSEGLFGITPPPPKEIPGAEAGAETAEIIVVVSLLLLLGLVLLLILVQIGFIGWILTEPMDAISAMGLGSVAEFIRGLF